MNGDSPKVQAGTDGQKQKLCDLKEQVKGDGTTIPSPPPLTEPTEFGGYYRVLNGRVLILHNNIGRTLEQCIKDFSKLNVKYSQEVKQDFAKAAYEEGGDYKDSERIKRFFTGKNNFKTPAKHDNCTKDRMEEILKNEAIGMTDKIDCFICVIMSHGGPGYVTGTDGKSLSVKQIVNFFLRDNCEKLRGKPKIFIIDACRGEEDDLESRKAEPETKAASLPEHADLLIANACIKNYTARFCHSSGSWYTKTLCEVFEEKWENMGLQSMLTAVNEKVAGMTVEENGTRWKQMPTFSSNLTKGVFFNQKPVTEQ